MTDKWVVDVKGEAGDRSWEISVLRSRNAHGKASFGWIGPDKLCISSSGGPCHDVVIKPVWTRLVALAHEVADELNQAEGNGPSA